MRALWRKPDEKEEEKQEETDGCTHLPIWWIRHRKRHTVRTSYAWARGSDTYTAGARRPGTAKSAGTRWRRASTAWLPGVLPVAMVDTLK